MNTKILFSSVAMGAALMMSGCGGGGSSDPQTGTAYYIDAAVSGVNYVCGAIEDKTGSDGSFTFEKGVGCTFYLGEMKLRDVDAASLKDGENLYETDVKIGRVLQALDSDGDQSNGSITIDDEIIAELQDSMMGMGLPVSAVSLDNAQVTEMVVQVIASNGGTYVSEADAQAHMNEARIKGLLAGKTLYLAYHGYLGKIDVNADATSSTWTTLAGGLVGETGLDPYRIEGEKLFIGEDLYLTVDEITEDYLLVNYFAADGTPYGPARLYNDEAKATAYYESFSVPDISDLIVGKTYYVTTEDSYTDENGNLVNNDHVETLVFGTDGKLNISWMEDGQQSTRVFDYSISGEVLSITIPDEGTLTFTNVEKLSDHLRFTDSNGDESGRFFFTYEAAEASLGGSN